MNKDRTWYLVSKKLAGEATAEERQELEELLRSDPDLHYALQNITDIWQLPSRPSAEAEDAFGRHLARMKENGADDWQEKDTVQEEHESSYDPDPFPVNRSRNKTLLLAVSMIGVLIVTSLFFYRAQQKKPAVISQVTTPEKNEISTRNGSKTKITLPDGSQVWLNSGSNLTYTKDFGNGLREVNLTGEAFFDVTKDTAHPFIIHTRKIDIRVVGTAFNVKSYPGDRLTETSLVRGKVEILIHNRPEEKIVLKPNEKLVVMDEEAPAKSRETNKEAADKEQAFVSLSRLTYRPTDSILVETAWVQNKLVFNNEPFREVVAKMERWYNVEFDFSRYSNKDARFTGVFETETIEQALAALSITGEFSYSITGNKVMITNKQ